VRKLHASPPRRDPLARSRADEGSSDGSSSGDAASGKGGSTPSDTRNARPKPTRRPGTGTRSTGTRSTGTRSTGTGTGTGTRRSVPPPEKSAPRRKARAAKPSVRAHASQATKARLPAGREVAVAKQRAVSPAEARLERATKPTLSPESHLAAALRAETPRERAAHARRGLARRSAIDRTTQAMLLRQLYLGLYEARDFRRAAAIGAQMVELGVLADVAHQDAARALQALGELDAATGHLRLAARASPASRRAFHWWTLGSVCFVHGRLDEALAALARAIRWSTRDRPLYRAHAAVVQCAAGHEVRGLKKLARALAKAPAGQGYGRFVLGQLALYDGRPADAKKHLSAFVRRTVAGRPILALALAPELEMAQRALDELCAAERRAA
jgi:tetratricopeptide (TPR) repeat protein